MELLKIREDLYVPTDFAKHHYYFADAEGKQKYTGITSITGMLAKPNLITWAAKEAGKRLGWLDPKYASEEERIASAEKVLTEIQEHEPEQYLAFLDEAVKAHSKKKDDAAAHGTDAHALVEEYINNCISVLGGNPNYNEYPPEIEKFVDWAQEYVERFLFSERRMASKKLFVAGTADFAYVGKDGKRYMGDFKTSSGIYGVDYWLQIAGYRLLAEGEGDEVYDGSTIVRLGKKGDFEVKYLYEYETYRDAFLACLTLYRADAAIKEFVV